MEDSLMSMRYPSNDERGWIMTVVSGLACVLGASIIVVDIPMRLIPRYRDFRIQDSTKFLSSSMALSFGVMEYSSLFSLLPESLSYLKKAGFSRRKAGFISIGCFIGGALAIMVISKILHRYMPSHAVGCDHSHDIEEDDAHDHHHEHRPSRSRGSSGNRHKSHSHIRENGNGVAELPTEASPLLQSEDARRPRFPRLGSHSNSWQKRNSVPAQNTRNGRNLSTSQERKLSMIEVPRRIKEFVLDRKSTCDEGGACYGYSDPCGQGCLKIIRNPSYPRRPSTIVRTSTSASNLREIEEVDSESSSSTAPMFFAHSHTHDSNKACKPNSDSEEDDVESDDDLEAQDGAHHHHIPTNTFLDLSLQTSIAIALHKIPEGFITYATNHVNPTLGVSVFIALLFHNVTEGFALALPLYLATNSRIRALIYAAVLGGLSQPLGALIATLWFYAFGSGAGVSNTLYGCMFAVTGGIMMSVGISLFCEAMAFNHNRNLGICFAFVGMGLLGVTGSLAGEWKN